MHTAQRMPLPLTVSCFSKIQIVFFPFWYRLTCVVPGKGPLNGCVCVCVCTPSSFLTLIRRTLFTEFTSAHLAFPALSRGGLNPAHNRPQRWTWVTFSVAQPNPIHQLTDPTQSIVPVHAPTQLTHSAAKKVKKGKVFPYSLPSVGPGAYPGVQAVSPQVT